MDPRRIAGKSAEIPLRRLFALGLEGTGLTGDARVGGGGAAARDISSTRLPFAVAEGQAKAGILHSMPL